MGRGGNARRAGCDNVLPADPTGGRAGDAGRRARPASNVVLAVIEAHKTIVECTHVAHRRARLDPATRWTPSTIGARVVGLPCFGLVSDLPKFQFPSPGLSALRRFRLPSSSARVRKGRLKVPEAMPGCAGQRSLRARNTAVGAYVWAWSGAWRAVWEDGMWDVLIETVPGGGP